MDKEILRQLYEMNSTLRSNTLINNNVLDAARQILSNIETPNTKLVVDDIYVKNNT